MWIKQSEDNLMPKWLKVHLSGVCSCGAEIENYYNGNECTNRRCPNPECPLTLAQRIADMCTILKIPGIKEGRGLALVKENGLKSHYEALPHIITNKPRMTLADYMRISFIPGIDNTWVSLCEGKTSVEEVFNSLPYKYKDMVEPYKTSIFEGLKYVDLYIPEERKVEPLIQWNVMLSGNIRGFDVREKFIAGINYVTKGLTNIKVVGKRKTDVFCLVQEEDEPIRGKGSLARECGIPIYTPKQFQAIVAEELRKALEKKGGQIS